MQPSEILLIVVTVIVFLVIVFLYVLPWLPLSVIDQFSDTLPPTPASVCGEGTKLVQVSDDGFWCKQFGWCNDPTYECQVDQEYVTNYANSYYSEVTNKLVDQKGISVSSTFKVAIGKDTKLVPLKTWQSDWQKYGPTCNRSVPDDMVPLIPSDRLIKVNFLLSNDKTYCAPGYCYVNGQCVTPYTLGNSCCPSCAYVPQDDGGCAGIVECDGTPCGDQTVVEYPGTVVTCTQDPVPNKDGTVTWNDTCTLRTLCDVGNGANEFECAISCKDKGDPVSTQRECSKKCFPKMWKWATVIKDGRPVGFWQSDTQWKTGDPTVKYCRGRGCVYKRDLGSSAKATSCSACTKCDTISDPKKEEIQATYCGSCESCILNIDPIDTGDCNQDASKEVTCSNLNTCTSCVYNKNNIFGETISNSCNQCEIPLGGCGFYTKNQYSVIGDSVTLRSDAINYQ